MRFSCILLFVAVVTGCSETGVPGTGTADDMTFPPSRLVASPETTAAILESYADAWQGEMEFALASPITLGFLIDGQGYTIELADDGGAFSAAAPERFDWGFETDRETLIKLNDGSLNALTAMGQARATDPMPLSLRLPEGSVPSHLIPVSLHFWNREWPETILFGEGTTRNIHGANATVLVYGDGLRSAWYQLKPGMHINADPADQTNDFDTAIIVTKGRFAGRLDGQERLFLEGETVLIPEGMRHEFYADEDQYGEFVILMWGENA